MTVGTLKKMLESHKDEQCVVVLEVRHENAGAGCVVLSGDLPEWAIGEVKNGLYTTDPKATKQMDERADQERINDRLNCIDVCVLLVSRINREAIRTDFVPTYPLEGDTQIKPTGVESFGDE